MTTQFRLNMKKPQKHAALIKEWADGAVIQWCDEGFTNWQETMTPSWDYDTLYRVKPELKPNAVTWYAVTPDGSTSLGYIERCHARTDKQVAFLRVEIDVNDPSNLLLVSATLEKP